MLATIKIVQHTSNTLALLRSDVRKGICRKFPKFSEESDLTARNDVEFQGWVILNLPWIFL